MSIDLLTGDSAITGHSRTRIFTAGGASGHRWHVAECACGWTSKLCHTQGHAANEHGAHVLSVAEATIEAES